MDITDEDCIKILKQVSGNGKFIGFSLKSLAGDVEGFLSAHYSLEIKYLNEDSEENTAVFFTKKNATDSGFLAEFAKSLDVFEKETFIYKLCKDLESLKNFKKFAPRCYLHKNGILVIEDLSIQGFSITEKNALYNIDQCKAALKTLSYYHAACLAYEELRTEKTGKKYRLNIEYPNEFAEKLFTTNQKDPCHQFLQASIKTMNDLVDKVEAEGMNKEEFKELLQKEAQENLNHPKYQSKYRFCCVHGDLWSKNIMFKTVKQDITECRLIDFQLLRYFLPSYDVILFLYANTTVAFRKQNQDTLFKHYYNCLSDQLRQYQIDCSNLISYQDLIDGAIISAPGAKIQAFNDAALMRLPENVFVAAMENPDLFRKILIENRTEYVSDIFDSNPEFKTLVLDELLDLKNALDRKQLYLNNNVF